METKVMCKQCGEGMKQGKRVEKSMALQILGVFVFLAGLVLLVFFPIGTIAGIVLIPAAFFLGYKKVKIWKCPSCDYFFDRA